MSTPKTIVVKGRVVDPRHIELSQPLSRVGGEVDVIVPADAGLPGNTGESLSDFLKHLPPGTRSRAEIDRQIDDERNAWERAD